MMTEPLPTCSLRSPMCRPFAHFSRLFSVIVLEKAILAKTNLACATTERNGRLPLLGMRGILRNVKPNWVFP